MKLFISLVALFAIYAPAAHSADYYGQCKTELSKVADQFSSYIANQSSECVDELNKPAGERSNQVIGQLCRNAQAQLAPAKSRAQAVCGQCRRLGNPQINQACKDNGVSSFIDAVGSL